MSSSLRVARIAGIDIKLHFTFLLVPLWGALQWNQFGTRGALFGAVLSLFVFTCVALHELGHSLVAKAFGISVKDITLLPIGGVARLGRRPKTPAQEFLIALAGPLVNVVIAAGLFAAAWSTVGLAPLQQAFENLHETPPTGVTLWLMLIASNAALAVFNMVPALPMDGGRVLRSVLAAIFGQRSGTKAAALIGRVLAVALFAFGVWSHNPMLPFIAAFVFMGAGVEVRETELQGVLEAVRSADAVNTQVPRFAPGTTIGEAMQALVFWPSLAFAVEHFGRFVGVVTREDLIAAAHEAGPYAYVASLTDKEVPIIGAADSLDVARQRMSETGKPYVAVITDGVLVGLVTELEIAHQLSVLQALQRSRQRGNAGASARRG